jgi:tetratricopeptide (TPR) repeat protein
MRRFAWVIVALMVLVVYARTIDAPFFWDDRHLILESEQVTTFRGLAYFSEPFWSRPESADARAYYRPITVASLALDHAIHGPNAAGFHLTNAFLHAVNSLLLFGLLRRHRVGPIPSLIVALLWGLHPRLSEAAAWVSGRTDLLAGMFVLLALLVHRVGSSKRGLGVSLLLLLGLLSKEVALAGVVSVVALELWPRVGRSLRARLTGAAFPLMALGAYLALRARALQGGDPSAVLDHVRLTLAQRAVAVLGALGHYAWMLAVPWLPSLQHGDMEHVDTPFAVAGAVVALAVVLGTIMCRRRLLATRPLVIVGAAWTAVGLGLVIHAFPISLRVLASDRFLYLPLAGLALVAGPYLAFLRRLTWVRHAGVGLVLASFVAATWLRVGDFCSEARLWAKTYRDVPETNALPATELGNVFYRAGLFREAAEIYGRSVPRAHVTWGLRANHANALAEIGRYPEARGRLLELCQERAVAKLCLDAGLAALHELDLVAAELLAREALRRAPNYSAAQAVIELIPRVRRAMEHAGDHKLGPAQRIAARFELANLTGRRVEALELAGQLLATRDAPPDLRRKATEYWVQRGHPAELEGVLQSSDVLDAELRRAAEHRMLVARELGDVWAELRERWSPPPH